MLDTLINVMYGINVMDGKFDKHDVWAKIINSKSKGFD